jgi:type IV secretion system protein VirB9
MRFWATSRPGVRCARSTTGGRPFIEFPPSIAVGEAPPLFVIGDNGEAQLVNYRVAGRYYVVDRLFGAAELRLGGKKQQVVRIASVQPKRRKGK